MTQESDGQGVILEEGMEDALEMFCAREERSNARHCNAARVHDLQYASGTVVCLIVMR